MKIQGRVQSGCESHFLKRNGFFYAVNERQRLAKYDKDHGLR
jgi:hypothetical protein